VPYYPDLDYPPFDRDCGMGMEFVVVCYTPKLRHRVGLLPPVALHNIDRHGRVFAEWRQYRGTTDGPDWDWARG